MSTMKMKSIIQEKEFENMKTWELIFRMLIDEKNKERKFRTQQKIAEATNSYWRARNYALKIAQGTVSKYINYAVEYKGITYRIAKTQEYIDGTPTEQEVYQLVMIDRGDAMWKTKRGCLLKEALLVPKKLCVVSPFMYIFKLQPKKDGQGEVITKTETKTDSDNESESAHQSLSDVAEKAKAYFRDMIPDRVLFDVSCVEENLFVILNNTSTPFEWGTNKAAEEKIEEKTIWKTEKKEKKVGESIDKEIKQYANWLKDFFL